MILRMSEVYSSKDWIEVDVTDVSSAAFQQPEFGSAEYTEEEEKLLMELMEGKGKL